VVPLRRSTHIGETLLLSFFISFLANDDLIAGTLRQTVRLHSADRCEINEITQL